MATARERYASLDDAERACIQRQRLKATRPLASWRHTIERLADFDAVGDAERKVARSRLMGAVAVLGLVGALSWVVFSGFGMPWKLVGGGVAAVAVVIFWVPYHRLSAIDIPDELRNFVGPLFVMLAEDLDPGKPVTLDVDLNRKRPSHRQGGARTMPIAGALKAGLFSPGITKIVEQHLQIPCFHLEGDLVDGSRVVVDVKDFQRVRTVHKKNRRGKHKSKSKTKTQRVIEAELTIPHKRYAVDTNSASQAKVKIGEKRSTLRTKKVVLVEGDSELNDTDPILRALAGLFQQTQPVGEGATS